MTIKEVITSSEKTKIAEFLARFSLKYEQNVDQTIYLEENGSVIATVSAAKYILKCLAVDPAYRSENYAVALVGEMIKRLHANGVFYYQVFTKPEYKDVFVSLGFSVLVETEKVVALEGGEGNVDQTIEKMRVQIRFTLGLDVAARRYDVAAVVLNGNPFTNGHLKLIEHAACRHDYVFVFVLEEEGSYFSFNERYSLAYVALKPLANVMVLPSSKYIVSKATFPGYFLKTVDETTEQYALFDATVFDKYFMKGLGISKRYIGSETSDYMSLYNQTLKRVFGDRVEEIPRFVEDGTVVSAKTVRALLEQGKEDDALKFVPHSTHALLKGMVLLKNGKR